MWNLRPLFMFFLNICLFKINLTRISVIVISYKKIHVTRLYSLVYKSVWRSQFSENTTFFVCRSRIVAYVIEKTRELVCGAEKLQNCNVRETVLISLNAVRWMNLESTTWRNHSVNCCSSTIQSPQKLRISFGLLSLILSSTPFFPIPPLCWTL